MADHEYATGHTDVTVRVHRAGPTGTLFAGLRQEWVAGTDPDTGTEFDMTSGAGLGSPYLCIHVRLPDGSTVDEFVDTTELLSARVAAIIAAHQATEALHGPTPSGDTPCA